MLFRSANLTYDDVKVTEDELREDIAVIWKAMHLFMNSRMVEAEEICTSGADHRLYYSGERRRSDVGDWS